jgi:hypothetical protein
MLNGFLHIISSPCTFFNFRASRKMLGWSVLVFFDHAFPFFAAAFLSLVRTGVLFAPSQREGVSHLD